MEKNERKKLYQKAIDTWGIDAQRYMLFEELGELVTAIAQENRGRVSKKDIITELADVSIMCEQMALFFGYDEYEKEKEFKLDRLKKRLEKY